MTTPALTLFLTGITAATAIAATPSLASGTPQSALRNPHSPNIIFILCDDLGYGDIGVYFQNARRAAGDHATPSHITPRIDRMAAEGARFTHHYCPSPLSAPSRASFLSGLSQGHANVRDSQFDKALADNHTVATVLKQAGYATAAIGKWGLHGQPNSEKKPATGWVKNSDWPAHPLNRGFDYFYGIFRHIDGHEHYPKEQFHLRKNGQPRGPVYLWENHTDVTDGLDKCYSADLYTARAKQWIIDHETQKPSQPFFIYLAYDTPHIALQIPTQAYPAGGGLKGGLQWIGKPGRMINTAGGKPDSWIHPDYANATHRDPRDPAAPEKNWPDDAKRYATSVRRIDDALGDIIQLLKDLDIDQDTLVILTSDNGPEVLKYAQGTITQFFASFGPFDGVKRDLWEGGLRVPAIARWPGRIPAGSEIAAPSASYDWLPTFAELAGLPPPANADGRSLLGNLLARPTPASRGAGDPADYLYFEFKIAGRTPDYAEFEPTRRNRLRNQMQALRQGDLLAVRYDVKNQRDDFEIYNVVLDPKETHDLGKAKTPEAAAMQTRFKALALQSRRPDSEAPRPYDTDPMPALAQPPAKTTPGLAWRCYEGGAGGFPWVPNCDSLRAAREGVAEKGVDVSGIPPGATPKDARQTCVVFTGYLRAPADGDYTFSYTAGAGALMRLHNATIIDADYGYKPGETKTASVRLQAGLHPVTLTCLVNAQNPPALKWSGPGFGLQRIPADAFCALR